MMMRNFFSLHFAARDRMKSLNFPPFCISYHTTLQPRNRVFNTSISSFIIQFNYAQMTQSRATIKSA